MRFVRRLSFESIEARRLLAVVDIPDNLAGLPSQQVASPVNIDNATGVRAAEIRLRYDPAVLSINASQIVAGSVWGNNSNVQVTANIDAATGTIAVFVSGPDALSSSSGSLVTFNFQVLAGATLGSTTALNLTEVRLNEGAITVTPAPQAGVDTTDGVITIGAGTGNTISGRVYSDSNLNNTIDANEGIPSVTITLINTTTNAETTIKTTASGEFQFTNVAAGTYRLQQKQPVAFINGGPNELTVTLVAGQALTGQNFREVGLQAQYVYNRLFTTLALPVGSTNWTNTIGQIVTNADAGVLRTISMTSTTTTDTSAASTEQTSLDAESPGEDSAGEFVETLLASTTPLSAGEAVDANANDSIMALANDWDDAEAEELGLISQEETVPPVDQDPLLLALLAAENNDSESSLFDA